jgi:hypothetical protein
MLDYLVDRATVGNLRTSLENVSVDIAAPRKRI